jgi:hypothetical protein
MAVCRIVLKKEVTGVFNKKSSLVAMCVSVFSIAAGCKPVASSSGTKSVDDRENAPKAGSKCTVAINPSELVYLSLDREVRIPVQKGQVLTVATPEPAGTVDGYVASFTKVELPESLRANISVDSGSAEKPTAWIRKEACIFPY